MVRGVVGGGNGEERVRSRPGDRHVLERWSHRHRPHHHLRDDPRDNNSPLKRARTSESPPPSPPPPAGGNPRNVNHNP
eukprot:5413738-Pyramimonas_sp.AAC.1